MTSRTPPKRQNSSVSTTSSGGRTVTARRRSSASNHHPPSSSSIFARLTGKRDSSDTDDSSRSVSPSQTSADGGVSDGSLRIAGTNEDENGDDRARDDNDIEAGPSDYWRRSPSPPPPQPAPALWRERSDEPWPEDLEDGGMDIWRPHQSSAGGRLTPPFVVRTPLAPAQKTLGGEGEAGQDMDYFQSQQKAADSPKAEAGNQDRDGDERGSGDDEDEDEAQDAQVDMREYERRMKDVFDSDTPRTALSPAASTASPGLGGFDSRRKLGRGGYDAAYRDILGEKAG